MENYFADKFFILIKCCMYAIWTNVAEHRAVRSVLRVSLPGNIVC